MNYKNTYCGRQHWTIYGCFDETTGAPVAVRFYGTEYQAQRLSYALACAFNASACWEGHTLSVNGQVHSRTWRGGSGKKNIPEYPARIAS